MNFNNVGFDFCAFYRLVLLCLIVTSISDFARNKMCVM